MLSLADKIKVLKLVRADPYMEEESPAIIHALAPLDMYTASPSFSKDIDRMFNNVGALFSVTPVGPDDPDDDGWFTWPEELRIIPVGQPTFYSDFLKKQDVDAAAGASAAASAASSAAAAAAAANPEVRMHYQASRLPTVDVEAVRAAIPEFAPEEDVEMYSVFRTSLMEKKVQESAIHTNNVVVGMSYALPRVLDMVAEPGISFHKGHVRDTQDMSLPFEQWVAAMSLVGAFGARKIGQGDVPEDPTSTGGFIETVLLSWPDGWREPAVAMMKETVLVLHYDHMSRLQDISPDERVVYESVRDDANGRLTELGTSLRKVFSVDPR